MKFEKRGLDQRGVLIMWLALFLLLLIGFVSVGVDLAKLATTQAQLQTAADAAALAGATAIDPKTGSLVETDAMTRAQTTGGFNKAYKLIPETVQILPSDISFQGDSQITVHARRAPDTGGPMITHFIGAFVPPLHQMNMSAVAVAVVRKTNTTCCGTIPVAAVPDTTFEAGCANIYELIPAGANSNYGFVDFPPCPDGTCAGDQTTGADQFRCLLANGYCCCLKEGQVLQSEPGTMSGPFRQGLLNRWDQDTDPREGICYDQYNGNGMRVVQVPVTDFVPGNGRTTVKIKYIASFFIRNKPQANPGGLRLEAEFINRVAPGGGGPGTGLTYSVHLVR